MGRDREERLEEALAQFITPMRGIPFEVVIRALCETTIVRFDTEGEDNRKLLDHVRRAMRNRGQVPRGLNLEGTRLTDPRKLDLLMGLVVRALARASRTASALLRGSRPRRKTRGYYAKSRFRIGFHQLGYLLRSDPDAAVAIWQNTNSPAPNARESRSVVCAATRRRGGGRGDRVCAGYSESVTSAT